MRKKAGIYVADLYDNLPKKDVVFEGKTTESIVQELRKFYTEEQEKAIGTVAIEIAVVPELSNYIKPKTLVRKKD